MREKGRRRDIEREGEIRERERERDVRDKERESERESHRALPYSVRSRRKSSGNLPGGDIKRKERLITKL